MLCTHLVSNYHRSATVSAVEAGSATAGCGHPSHGRSRTLSAWTFCTQPHWSVIQSALLVSSRLIREFLWKLKYLVPIDLHSMGGGGGSMGTSNCSSKYILCSAEERNWYTFGTTKKCKKKSTTFNTAVMHCSGPHWWKKAEFQELLM